MTHNICRYTCTWCNNNDVQYLRMHRLLTANIYSILIRGQSEIITHGGVENCLMPKIFHWLPLLSAILYFQYFLSVWVIFHGLPATGYMHTFHTYTQKLGRHYWPNTLKDMASETRLKMFFFSHAEQSEAENFIII